MHLIRQLARPTSCSRRASVNVARFCHHPNRMKKTPYIPTPEELALAESRRRLRQEKREKAANNSTSLTNAATPSKLLARPWLPLKGDLKEEIGSRRVTILTWNLLAQCLVRRELFPTSDCLKAAQRENLIHEEILRQNADILCLQEVDRLDKLCPMLERAGYSHFYASGERKLHGCLIAFKRDLYTLVSSRVVSYDTQTIGVAQKNIGASFKTRNIAGLVGLQRRDCEDLGVVVATTHLFWHPRYTYERIRQAGILVRETAAFKQAMNISQWPVFLAGDFNFDPSDPAYSLMRGDSLLTAQEDKILPSMVVHSSIDPSVLNSSNPVSKGNDEDEDVDPDRSITNARPCTPQDGLLSVPEIVEWFSQLPNFRSAYDEGLSKARHHDIAIPTFGQRTALEKGRLGQDEPEYTSFTHYWQSVLDYIFVADDPNSSVNVIGLLAPLTAEDMQPGLPQKRVSGSDHTCLMVELSL